MSTANRRREHGNSTRHRSRRSETPIRAALRPGASIGPHVRDGLDGLKAAHRQCLADEIRAEFVDSIDLDEALRPGLDQALRWDYLLGHAPTSNMIALEPHHATVDQVSRVIKKRRAALDQLRPLLKPGMFVSTWIWVASGTNQFADTERVRRRLDQHGILFVGTRVLRKHLPPSLAGSKARSDARRATR